MMKYVHNTYIYSKNKNTVFSIELFTPKLMYIKAKAQYPTNNHQKIVNLIYYILEIYYSNL